MFGWEAVSSTVYVESPLTGGLVDVPGRQAIVRGDTGQVMGIFTDSYQPHPYVEWLINTVAAVLDDELSIGSAGLLKGGAVAWVSVEVPENLTIPEGVEFRPHLLAATSFDGSMATTFKRAVTNVVCDNTMAAGLAEAGQQVKIRHSRHSRLRIGEARQALNIVYEIADDFAAEVSRLCRTPVSDSEWNAFLDTHAPRPEEAGRSRTIAENRRDALTRLWSHDIRVAPWRNTAWGVVQAVNTFTHHEQTIRGAVRAERNMLRAVTGRRARPRHRAHPQCRTRRHGWRPRGLKNPFPCALRAVSACPTTAPTPHGAAGAYGLEIAIHPRGGGNGPWSIRVRQASRTRMADVPTRSP